MPSLQTPKYNQFQSLLTLCQRRTHLSSKSCHSNLQKCSRFNPIINRSSSSSPLVCTLDQYQVHATFHSPIFFSPSLLPRPNLLLKKKVNQENEELATPIVPASLNNHFKSSLVYKPIYITTKALLKDLPNKSTISQPFHFPLHNHFPS